MLHLATRLPIQFEVGGILKEDSSSMVIKVLPT
jgi:hypothetical protein